jgi:hypothetical protein
MKSILAQDLQEYELFTFEDHGIATMVEKRLCYLFLKLKCQWASIYIWAPTGMSGSVKVVANAIGHILYNVMQMYKMKYKNEGDIMYDTIICRLSVACPNYFDSIIVKTFHIFSEVSFSIIYILFYITFYNII